MVGGGVDFDGGGIYTLGRQPGTKLVGNWIHDVPVNAGRAESNEGPTPTPGDKPVPGKKAKAIRDDAGRQIGVTHTR